MLITLNILLNVTNLFLDILQPQHVYDNRFCFKKDTKMSPFFICNLPICSINQSLLLDG